MASRPTKVVTLFNETDEEAWVIDRVFEDSIILGPSVLALFENVIFDGVAISGDPEAALIEIPPGKNLQGIIGLRNVTFRRCWFQDIAIIGPPEVIQQFRETLQIGQGAPPWTQVAQAPERVA